MIEALHDDEETLKLGVPVEVHSELDARWLMIEIEKKKRRQEKKKALLKEITELYHADIDAYDKAIERDRESLRIFLETVNAGEAVSFPDVGTAYLTTVREKITVEDKGPASEWAVEYGCVKTEADLTAAKAKALEEMKRTGEVPRGFGYVPEGRTLGIRGR